MHVAIGIGENAKYSDGAFTLSVFLGTPLMSTPDYKVEMEASRQEKWFHLPFKLPFKQPSTLNRPGIAYGRVPWVPIVELYLSQTSATLHCDLGLRPMVLDKPDITWPLLAISPKHDESQTHIPIIYPIGKWFFVRPSSTTVRVLFYPLVN